MASLSSFLQSFAVLLVLILANLFALAYCSDGAEADKKVATTHLVDVHSLFPSDVCTTKYKEITGPSTLTVSHRHGPCSPLNPEKKPSHLLILNQDQLRVHWLHNTGKSLPASSLSNSSSLSGSKISARSGNSFGTGNYVVTVGFGTPTVQQTVTFDTGSDVTWIQCQPCARSCHRQQEAIFNPTSSSTYANISCTSPYCSALDISGCSGSTCLYGVLYGDNSQTVGFFAQDTLTLSPSDTIPNFRFGCGEDNNYALFGQVAGLMGLGRRTSVSFPSQTTQKYGGAFSYCLPATASSTGYLSFGSSPASSRTQFTPLLSESSRPGLYFVELDSISVGGKTLSVPSTLFSTAGVAVDSGTVITRLPPTAYSALRSAFRRGMMQYPMAPSSGLFDTCYDFTGHESVSIPTVALNFRGVSANLDPTGIIYAESPAQACLGFAPNGEDTDLVIVGNTQQRRFNVVYDVPKGVVGFGANGC